MRRWRRKSSRGTSSSSTCSRCARYTDYFVVCTGSNPRQTKGIWDEMHARLKKDDGLLPRSVAGEREATWIVADYLDVVSCTSSPPTLARSTGLDDLWGDVPQETLEAASA